MFKLQKAKSPINVQMWILWAHSNATSERAGGPISSKIEKSKIARSLEQNSLLPRDLDGWNREIKTSTVNGMNFCGVVYSGRTKSRRTKLLEG